MRDRVTLLRGRATLGTVLELLALVHGDRHLVEQPGPIGLAGGRRTLTYREAADLVARAATALRSRAVGGERLVVRGASDYGFFLTCLAVCRAGGVVVPVNPLMRDDEIEAVVADAGASVVEVEQLASALEAASGPEPAGAASSDPDDVAGIFYTSGTTGRPKGARLTHRALLTEPARGLWWPGRLRRDEVVAALPVAHIMGFSILLGAAFLGVPTYFIPHFRPGDVLDAIERRRATVFVGVPAMYRMLLDAGAEERDLTSVRLWVSGADAMPNDVARRFKRMGATLTLPGIERAVGEAAFMEGYGMVELAGGASVKLSPPFVPLGLGDFLGFSLPGFRMRVIDDEGRQVRRGELGELWVKGPGALRGYHGDAAGTREVLTDDGWVRTGDLARRGRLGAVRFAGRRKDVIVHGGYTVYAAEVEQALERHPAVAEAAVVGRPDDVKGEVPVAFVRLEPGASALPAEIRAWAAERLADYKAPVAVEVVDELPRTGTGKVAKAELVARL